MNIEEGVINEAQVGVKNSGQPKISRRGFMRLATMAVGNVLAGVLVPAAKAMTTEPEEFSSVPGKSEPHVPLSPYRIAYTQEPKISTSEVLVSPENAPDTWKYFTPDEKVTSIALSTEEMRKTETFLEESGVGTLIDRIIILDPNDPKLNCPESYGSSFCPKNAQTKVGAKANIGERTVYVYNSPEANFGYLLQEFGHFSDPFLNPELSFLKETPQYKIILNELDENIDNRLRTFPRLDLSNGMDDVLYYPHSSEYEYKIFKGNTGDLGRKMALSMLRMNDLSYADDPFKHKTVDEIEKALNAKNIPADALAKRYLKWIKDSYEMMKEDGYFMSILPNPPQADPVTFGMFLMREYRDNSRREQFQAVYPKQYIEVEEAQGILNGNIKAEFFSTFYQKHFIQPSAKWQYSTKMTEGLEFIISEINKLKKTA